MEARKRKASKRRGHLLEDSMLPMAVATHFIIRMAHNLAYAVSSSQETSHRG